MIWADVHPDDRIPVILIDNPLSYWISARMGNLAMYILCNHLWLAHCPCINTCGRPRYLEGRFDKHPLLIFATNFQLAFLVRYRGDSKARMGENTGGITEALKGRNGP
jgi:hypothetical protein